MRRSLRRKKRVRKTDQGEVELNMAAMLDMAFQLLAFFILTFNPSDVEVQISMLMPAKKPLVDGSGQQSNNDDARVNDSLGFPLEVSISANETGAFDDIRLGGKVIPSDDPEVMLKQLQTQLQETLRVPGFEGVELSVDTSLKYEWLIKAVDVITSQKLPTGESLTRLSISRRN